MALTAKPFFRPFPACKIDKSMTLGSMWVEGTESKRRIGSVGCNLQTDVSTSCRRLLAREDVGQLGEDRGRDELSLLYVEE